MMENDELAGVWARYRAACPDVEAGPDFGRDVWRRIDARDSFLPVFGRVGRAVAIAAAALCGIVATMNVVPHQTERPGYVDLVAAEHSPEAMFYGQNPDGK